MAVVLVLLSIAVLADGAFSLRQWGPIAVFALVMLACVRRRALRGPGIVVVGAAWAYALWTLLSALWADSPGGALEGSARNLLYAALVTLPLVTLPDRKAALRLAGGLTLGLAAAVVATFVACLSDGAPHFLAGRLNDPVGYRNATAALFAMAFWPLLCMTAQRGLNPLLRAAAFGTATTSLGLAFLTQSRGVLIGFCLGAVVALALGPDRVRRAWLSLMAVAGVAIAAQRLLVPYDALVATGQTSAPAITKAMEAMAVLAAASFAVVLLLALFDGGLRVSAEAQRALGRVAAGLLVALTCAVLVGGLIAVGDPIKLVRDKAQEFRQLDVAAPAETRLGSTGGQRYDLWRIALNEFRSAPVTGVGEGSYPVGYYAQRHTDRNLSTPHSLPMQTLAETGLVGLLLLITLPIAAAVAVARGWGRASPAGRRWGSALLASGTVLLGQASVDWLWLIPGLSGLGLTCLALGVALIALPDAREPARPGRPEWRLVSGLVPLVAALLVGFLYLSDLDVRLARAKGRTSPVAQLDTARTAQRLDPVALTPRYLQAGALETLGRPAAALAVLRRSLELEPRSFVTMALLGDLELRAGHPGIARAWYRRALALNPRDAGLQKLATGKG